VRKQVNVFGWKSGYESDEWIVHSDGNMNENNQHECTEGYWIR
jgi:hypothetical protein